MKTKETRETAATATGHSRSRSRVTINVSIDVANNAELRTNAQYVLESTRAARPTNTVRNYKPKQAEFHVRILPPHPPYPQS
jgi:hypothetical protein